MKTILATLFVKTPCHVELEEGQISKPFNTVLQAIVEETQTKFCPWEKHPE